jgi:hypothetical protein
MKGRDIEEYRGHPMMPPEHVNNAHGWWKRQVNSRNPIVCTYMYEFPFFVQRWYFDNRQTIPSWLLGHYPAYQAASSGEEAEPGPEIFLPQFQDGWMDREVWRGRFGGFPLLTLVFLVVKLKEPGS